MVPPETREVSLKQMRGDMLLTHKLLRAEMPDYEHFNATFEGQRKAGAVLRSTGREKPRIL